jgi:putative hydrolase of the HAD superfamily
MDKIKNIIFDLGGVIINLDTPKTITEFNKLSDKPFEAIYTQLQQTPVFDLFDKGLVDEAHFFNALNVAMEADLPHEDLLKAWNAMLLDFPLHRLELLKQLKSRYRLFLLSNTNETHIREFEAHLLETRGYQNLEPFFEKVYYSCRMGMRKPDPEIFEFVLKENQLIPEETVFIDDTIHHIEGALKTGIRAHLLAKGKEVGELVKELGLV